MKNIYLLILLLFTFSMSGQKKRKTYQKPIKLEVRGVKLTYNKLKHTMTIEIPDALVSTDDFDRDTSVRINNNFVLNLVINGETETIISDDDFFMLKGHRYGDMSFYYKIKPYDCKEIVWNRKWVVHNVEPGEYVLQVADVCYDKQFFNIKTGSLIIP